MKVRFEFFAKFVGFSILFFVLSRANVGGMIFPFAFPMLFALAWANQKVWMLAPAYLIGYIANFHSFEGLFDENFH